MKNKISFIVIFVFCTILLGLFTKTSAIVANNFVLNVNENYKSFDRNSIIKKNFLSEDDIIFSDVPRGIVISINSEIFFDIGNDKIKETSKPLLDDLGNLIKTIDKPCIIESNTFSNIVENPYYDTNWELAVIRSQKIVEYFIENVGIKSDNIRSMGLGDFCPQNSKVIPKKKLMFESINFVIINFENSSIDLYMQK